MSSKIFCHQIILRLKCVRLDLGGLKAVEGRAVGIVDILGVRSEHLTALLAEGRGEVGRLELSVGS